MSEEPSIPDKLDYLSMVCANPSDSLSAGVWCEAANEGLLLARQLDDECNRLKDSLAPDLLRNRIARYIRDLEPVVTSRGLANFLSSELLHWTSLEQEKCASCGPGGVCYECGRGIPGWEETQNLPWPTSDNKRVSQ